MIFDNFDDLEDIHDAGANRCNEEHHDDRLKDVAHVCEATWQATQVFWELVRCERLITLPDDDAGVLRLHSK